MKHRKAKKVLEVLKKQYPNFCITLGRNSFEILISTMLSAQANDKQTIPASKELLKRYKSPQDLAMANAMDVERTIKRIGLYKTKARRVILASKILVEKYNGKVPSKMEELIKLPGVGRKTANIVLSKAFGKVEGIAVDTHVFRVSRRLGLSQGKTALAVERDLMDLYPQSEWCLINEIFIAHGRNTCKAKRPNCNICKIKAYCDFYKNNKPINQH
ncbi:MAG: endonuclease III [Candidatus Diapherotrites archaeon]